MGLHIRPVAKGSENLSRMLSEAIARELAGNTQYIWHHLQLIGSQGAYAADRFREVAMKEMKHAEAIAERLSSLGRVPEFKPRPVPAGGTLNESLELGAQAKEETIQFYKTLIEQAEKDGDVATVLILKEILEDEEEHRELLAMMIQERSRSWQTPSRHASSPA